MEKEQQTSLDSFLANNDELEQLSARLGTFNVFRTLRIESAEIRHSNVLSWLLDPAESHRLGDVFLRRFLSNVLLTADHEISAANVELLDLTDIEVRREWKHCDLLVIDRTNKILLLLENKIGSGESQGQLARYGNTISEEFPTFKVIHVFLTLDGEPSLDKTFDFVPCSYSQLLLVLERIIRQRRQQLPEPVAMFFTHYIDTLRRLTMQDKELVDLCKSIYRKHKNAIDLIVKYGMNTAFGSSATEILEKSGCEILHETSNWLYFIPTT